MKIEAKKCLTCGADLKFKYGEENASCPYCKREYIIEYESPNYADLIQLKKYYAKLARSASKQLEKRYEDSYMCSEEEMRSTEKLEKKIDEYNRKAKYFKRIIDTLSDKEILKNKL